MIGAVASARRGRAGARRDRGYTCANDVSARDVQFGDGQWFRGKGFDTFCPIGPKIVPAGELDPSDLRIQQRLNGEVLQDDRTTALIFDIPYLVSYISQAITLEPGDLILTGTPVGVGVFREPKVALAAGDVVEVEIEGIGILRNEVRAADRREQCRAQAPRLPLAKPGAEVVLRGRDRRGRRARARDRVLPGPGARHHRRRRARARVARGREHHPQHDGHPLELPLGRERRDLRALAEALGGARGGARLRPAVQPARRAQPGALAPGRPRERAPGECEPAERDRRRVARARRRRASSARS